MDDGGTRISTDVTIGKGRLPPGASPSSVPSCASAARRAPVHVHATPAAAIAEMDARRRRWAEWLTRPRTG